MGRLDDKIALITGSASGIGRTAALLFAREGAAVVIADLSTRDGKEVEREITAAGGRAMFVGTDVTVPKSVEQAIARCVSRFGGVDILYNNAGGSTLNDGPVTEVAIEEFWRCIKLDLFGTWLVCRYGIPELVRRGGGSVINTSSLLALVGFIGKDAYIPAKGGVAALTRSMAVEYAASNVRVNALAPGMVDTARGQSHRKAGATPPSVVRRHLLGPVAPVDVANAALYLASDESRAVTGEILRIDSGYMVS